MSSLMCDNGIVNTAWQTMQVHEQVVGIHVMITIFDSIFNVRNIENKKERTILGTLCVPCPSMPAFSEEETSPLRKGTEREGERKKEGARR